MDHFAGLDVSVKETSISGSPAMRIPTLMRSRAAR
jgi:hypothetical protein